MTYSRVHALAYQELRPGYPDLTMSWIRAQFHTGAPNILEVGCGPGNFTIDATVKLAPWRSYHAIDASPAMIERIRARCPASTPTLGRAEALPLEPGSVDVLICPSSFHQFDQPKALAEFRRVLVARGSLLLLWNQVGHSLASSVTSARTTAIRNVAQDASWFYRGELHVTFTHHLPDSDLHLSDTCLRSLLPGPVHTVEYTSRAYSFESKV